MLYFTGIGSRDTIYETEGKWLEQATALLTKKGYWLRSGGATGADTFCEKGVYLNRKHIYLPWDYFNGHSADGINYFHITDSKILKEARLIAKKCHPVWDKLKPSHQDMHTRNVFQVLGHTLDQPSEFVLLSAEPNDNDGVSGGSNTAYQVAKLFDVPTFNVYNELGKHLFFEDLKCRLT